MVSESAVRDLLITCVDNLHTVEAQLDDFVMRYQFVLERTAVTK